jgi:hypothetical protein
MRSSEAGIVDVVRRTYDWGMARMPMTDLRREVARGLVFDGRDRLLLIKWRDPITATEFWELVGAENLVTADEQGKRNVLIGQWSNFAANLSL